MRLSLLAIVGFLIFGAAILTIWPLLTAQLGFTTSPPGQYPIGAPRFEWPMTQRAAPYRPGPGMGSDMVAFTDPADAKARCALTKTCA